MPKAKKKTKPKVQRIVPLTDKEKEFIYDRVECEGFDYGLMNFSGDIKNKHFQMLLTNLENARQALADFCDVHI